eukprot:9498515-Pyramimonas_sp.AAC.1
MVTRVVPGGQAAAKGVSRAGGWCPWTGARTWCRCCAPRSPAAHRTTPCSPKGKGPPPRRQRLGLALRTCS